MQDQLALRKRLDGCEYIYLDWFGPASRDVLGLEIEVVEARPDRQNARSVPSRKDPVDDHAAVVDILIEGSWPIRPQPGCARFVITFDRYISFCARDETFMIPEEDEDYPKRLRAYEKSAFLDFFRARTSEWAQVDHLGPVKHYAVSCLNVVIDVICETEPTIAMTILE